MADDRYTRSAREPYRRDPADNAVDPLTELARLIGQPDPFTNAGRPARREAAEPAGIIPRDQRAAAPEPRVAEPRFDEPPVPEPRDARAGGPRFTLPDFGDHGDQPGWRDDRRDAFRDREPVFDDPRYGRAGADARGHDPAHGRGPDEGYDRGHEPAYEPEDDPDYDDRAPAAESRAGDTYPWRPSDPYHHTEGMFPREPQFGPLDLPLAEPAAEPEPEEQAYEARQPSARLGDAGDHGGHFGDHRGDPSRGLGDHDQDFDDRGYGGQSYGDVRQDPRAGWSQSPGYAPRPAAAHQAAAAGTDLYTQRLRQPDPHGEAAYTAGRPAAAAPAAQVVAQVPEDAYAGAPQGYGEQAYRGYEDRDADPYAGRGEAGYAPEDYDYSPAAAGPPARPRRRLVRLAAVVVGLAVVGSAAAFGYRAVFSAAPKPAPVIRADNAPTKVVPAAHAGDAANKQIYDRIADKPQNERVVSREEQPVEIRDASRPPTPRMVFPNSVTGSATPGASAPIAQPAAPTTGQPAGGQEPKRIRTVTIRSDQGIDPAKARAQAQQPAQTPPPAAARPASASSTPLPLAPGAAAPAAPATRTAAAPASGGYVVQVSAQKTQEEAQASFRTIQARYPSQLGGRSPIIRRKDTASGAMYGAQVGPFASRDEAVQLCEGLKAAGGSCFVQRN